MSKKLSEHDAELARSLMADKYDDKMLLKTYRQRSVSICGSGDWYRVARFASWVAEHAPDFWKEEPENACIAFCYFRLKEMADTIKASDNITDYPDGIENILLIIGQANLELSRRGELGLITGEGDNGTV